MTRTNIAAALGFLALTGVVTFPQILYFGTSVPFHSDSYFSMWSLGWVAHSLAHSPRALFEANIFYPEHHTFAYTDAMLLNGVVCAPLFWIGVTPVAIYNLALFAAFALSGFAMFVLARELTGNVAAAFLSGLIYAFAPYRLGHYVHLPLQVVFWIPLAVLMIHRIVANGRLRDGVLLGAAVGLQVLSSIYMAIFLATYFVVFVPCLVLATAPRQWRRLVVPLIVAGAVTMALALPYVSPYLQASRTVGTRSLEGVSLYSATLTNFLSAPQMNRLYGSTAITKPALVDEMNIFPGVVAVALALLGVIGGSGRVRLVYFAGFIFAVAMTMGTNTFVYPWFFEHVPLFHALRSAVRFDIVVTFSLAVLSAYGAAFLFEKMRSDRSMRIAAAAIGVLLIAEYASAPSLTPVPKPSKVDARLAQMPPTVIVELPLASSKATWGSLDWLYMYQGLPHFQKMLNGYSGYAPPSYYEMRQTMSAFPDDRSMAFLRERGVEYVVLRGNQFEPYQEDTLLEQIQKRQDLSLESMWMDGPDTSEALFKVRK